MAKRLRAGQTMVATTAFDMVAAKLAAAAGFDAVFCSGYGQAASHLGRPDAGLLDLDVVTSRAASMVASVDVPVLVDADDGFGRAVETFRSLEDIGAAAVMLEDQIPDKRCGHVPGKQVIEAEAMCQRIEEVVAARRTSTLLIARTDAREPLGLDEALSRGRSYAEAGADIVFVEAPESTSELERVGAALPGRAMANMLPGGRTPPVPADELSRMGFALVVHGLVDLMVAAGALRDAFAEIRRSGTFTSYRGAALTFAELNELTGLTGHVTRPR